MDDSTAVVVGGGVAASEAALGLRQNGWAHGILLLSEESRLPYHRPPLSKGLLTGVATSAGLALKPEAAYVKANVELRLQARVTRIDRGARQVHLHGGETLRYGRLVLATGGRPRRLVVPGMKGEGRPENLHYLRTAEDAEGIRAQLVAGQTLVVLGGGYIGLEVAASARKLGVEVTVLEAMPRVLARVTAPELSAFFARIHREAGVAIRTECGLESLELDPTGTRVAAVLCSDGARIVADVVVVGIGLLPNVELAAAAGLEVDDGIVVDALTRTTDPDIHAIGDCSNAPSDFYRRRVRLESVPSALEQARVAVAVLCGKPPPPASVPWFWSEQYDVKLQTVGLSAGYDRLVFRGSPESRSFVAFYLHGRELLAVDAVNRSQEFVAGKRLVAERIAVDVEQLADEAFALKTLLPPPAAVAARETARAAT